MSSRAAIICLVLVLLVQSPSLATGVAGAQDNCRVFHETGKSICGVALEYWEQHGGLAQHGYPLSNAAEEKSYGRVHTMQYFERSVFEISSGSNQIAVLPLGSMRNTEKYSKTLPRQVEDTQGEPNSTVAQGVRQLFERYWKEHGGLLLHGYPMTRLVVEKSDFDGKEYIMQYFEKSVFEYHPGNPETTSVLLTHLGRIEYYRNHPELQNVVTGDWGGQGVLISEHQGRLLMRFGCDFAQTDGPTIAVLGRYNVTGLYSSPPIGRRFYTPPVPVRFKGTLNGDTLTIGVYNREGEYLRGVYTATRGGRAELGECGTPPYVEPIGNSETFILA